MVGHVVLISKNEPPCAWKHEIRKTLTKCIRSMLLKAHCQMVFGTIKARGRYSSLDELPCVLVLEALDPRKIAGLREEACIVMARREWRKVGKSSQEGISRPRDV